MKLFLFLFVIGLILFIAYCISNKVRIKFKTFLKKGFAPVRGNFGLYTYCGAQGKGKTYSINEYLQDNKNDIEVFCNIKGIANIDYTYFTGFKELLKLKEMLDNDTLEYDKTKQLVFVYDEIFTELLRGDKLSKPVLDFLCQMRKRKIIFLTTAQYWSEIPITFRRFCRFQIDCNMINLFGLGILIKTFHDAENMKWEEQEQDFVAPIVETTITKCRVSIANSYDTFLRISSVEVPLKGTPTNDENASKKEEIDKEFWDNEFKLSLEDNSNLGVRQ